MHNFSYMPLILRSMQYIFFRDGCGAANACRACNMHVQHRVSRTQGARAYIVQCHARV